MNSLIAEQEGAMTVFVAQGLAAVLAESTRYQRFKSR
jgi:hypothetical protein